MKKYFCLFAVLSPVVSAGGLSLYETGATNMSLANSGSAALAQDASTLSSNPAGMSRLEGTQLQANGGWVQGHMEISDSGNAAETLPLGSFYLTHAINNDWHVGFSTFGSHGAGLNYLPDWQGRYHNLESTLSSIVTAISLSHRIDEKWSVGGSFMGAKGSVTSAVATPHPGGDGLLSYEGNDWSTAYMLGVLYEVSEHARFGLSYTSQINYKFQGDVKNSVPYASYNLITDTTMPQAVTLSAVYSLNDKWMLLGSANWQQWSKFGEAGLTIDSVSKDIDLHYKDTWHLSIGTQFIASSQVKFRGGISYDSSPVEDIYRSASLPLSDAWRLGLGADYNIRENLTMSVGYTFAWFGDVPLNINSEYRGDINGSYDDSYLHFVNVGIEYKFK